MVGRSILGRPEVVEISSTVGFCGFFCGTELLNVCTYYVEMHNINIYIYMYIYAYCYESYSILVYVYTLYMSFITWSWIDSTWAQLHGLRA